MMIRRFQLLSISFFFAGILSAQVYDTTSYNIKFVSEREGMWSSGITELPAMSKDYTFSWQKDMSLGGIESVLGMDFGMEFSGKTSGTVGLGYYMSNINGGSIDSVIYPINIEFMIPQAADIRAGQTIKIGSRVKVDDTQKPSIETTYPLEGKLGVKMIFKLQTDIDLSVCAFDACLSLNPETILPCISEVMDFNFDKPLLELSTLGSEPKITVPDFTALPCIPDLSFDIPCVGNFNLLGDIDYWPTTQDITFFPVEFGLSRPVISKHPNSKYVKCLLDTTKTKAQCDSISKLSSSIKNSDKLPKFLEGYFSIPFIDTLYTTATKSSLFSKGSDTALSMVFKPLNLIAGGKFFDGRFDFPIPCTGGSFYARYMLIRPTLNLDVLAKQDMSFDAQVVVSMQLPSALSYKVMNAAGKIISSGNSDLISYEVGNDLHIDFPCNFEYIDFKPSFKLKNKFTNRTYVSMNMDGTLQALEAGIGLDNITIIPEIELCIPNPFGDDWCATIPEVSFGFDAGIGPLVDESISKYMANPNDLNLEIDIFNKNWEIKSFPQISTPSFRVAPTPFIAMVAPDTIQCFGATDASLEVMITGGTPPYSHLWSDNSTAKQDINLPAGDYYVKVTDKNNCVAFNGAKIFEYPKLEIASSKSINPECFGEATGSISCTIKGGREPYNYVWSNGSTASQIDNVTVGNYSLTVTDRNGCMFDKNFTLVHPAELKAYVNNKTDVLCYGDNTGSIKLNVSGGVPGYDFYWSNGAISKDADSLFAGLHSVKVIDRNNCSITITQQVDEPTLLTAVLEVQKAISCYKGSDGELFANITGGIEPYAITWYDPENKVNSSASSLTRLKEGVYQMEVYDANRCFLMDSLQLIGPKEAFKSILTETNLSCYGSNDGRFDLEITGGTPPFSYLWSDGSTDKSRTGLAAAPYKLSITDSKLCMTYNNTVLLEPHPITGSFAMTRVSCEGESDGSLEFFPKGGTPPYSVNWSNGSLGELATSLPLGIHLATITDFMGCEENFEYEVLLDGSHCFDIPNAFSPNGDGYNDTWVIKNISIAYPNHEVRIFAQQGNVLYSSGRGSYIPWDGKFKDEYVPSGTYYFIIDFGNGSEPGKGSLTIVR